MLGIWIPLFAIALLASAWYHTLRLRELVTAHARALCQRHGLQLLDDSVAMHRIRVDWRGTLRIRREYRFETSVGGNDRQTAMIAMLGDRIVSASLPEKEPIPHDVSAQAYVQPHARPTQSVASDGDNVIPIERARRTLH